MCNSSGRLGTNVRTTTTTSTEGGDAGTGVMAGLGVWIVGTRKGATAATLELYKAGGTLMGDGLGGIAEGAEVGERLSNLFSG